MPDRFLKTVILTGIFFLATTSLSQAFSFTIGEITNHLKEDTIMINAIDGKLNKAALADIKLWDSKVWGKLISDVRKVDFDADYRSIRVGIGDGILGLYDNHRFGKHGRIGYGMIDECGKEFGRDFIAWANHVESSIRTNGPHCGATGVAPVPEPATMLLLGTGMIGLAGFGRRKIVKNQKP